MAVTTRNPQMGNAMSDDLPRTLRREREARERAGQVLTASGMSNAPASSQPSYVPEPTMPASIEMSGGTVTDIRIPFFRLMMLCFKLVLAAIPALILLGVLLWTAGHLLMTYFPWLVKLQILIRVPN